MRAEAGLEIAIVLCALIGQTTSIDLQNGAARSEEPSVAELAARLLEIDYPGSYEKNDVQLLGGKLPENMSLDLPIPDGSRIVGSKVQEGTGIDIVLDVSMTPEQAVDFYRQNLGGNWTETKDPFGHMGFIPEDFHVAYFCQGSMMPYLTVTAYPLENETDILDGTDLRLNIGIDPANSHCMQAASGTLHPMGPIPVLLLPKGAIPSDQIANIGSENEVWISSTLETELNSSSLADYYADQLEAANWTMKYSERCDPTSWSSWVVEDQDGMSWKGMLISLDLSETDDKTLIMVEASVDYNSLTGEI